MTHNSATTPGRLYIVATPIGNLDDITIRAIQTLKEVDIILAEDTRHSRKLLSALGIKTPLQSLHAFNEAEKSEQLVDALIKGKHFALISDAGTPLISDPGYPLVKLAREKHIYVTPIPGACAFIAALSAAGISCDAFTFLGFLPAKANARQQTLHKYKNYPHTLVFYESPHRILACLDDIKEVFTEHCEVVLAKELTKTFERFVRGYVTTVKTWLLADHAHQKGEFVLMLPPRIIDNNQNKSFVLDLLLAELPLKQAVKLTSQITGINKNDLYQQALRRVNN